MNNVIKKNLIGMLVSFSLIVINNPIIEKSLKYIFYSNTTRFTLSYIFPNFCFIIYITLMSIISIISISGTILLFYFSIKCLIIIKKN